MLQNPKWISTCYKGQKEDSSHSRVSSLASIIGNQYANGVFYVESLVRSKLMSDQSGSILAPL